MPEHSEEKDPLVWENEVIRQMRRMLGYVPLGTRDMLRCLTHPDIWPLMRAYGEAKAVVHD